MEKLPNIYSPKNYQYNQNKNIISKQSIKQRNDVIDEYIKSLDNKNERKQNENSLSNSEDDKDPFSPTSLKRVKAIKKLILPNFKKRENIKSQSSTTKGSKKLKKKNNNSDNNIINKYRKDARIPNIKGVNNLLNSKWSTSSSNYINYMNHSRQEKMMTKYFIIVAYIIMKNYTEIIHQK